MGAVDLVIQVESPKSVARGLQRIGRAGHTVEAVSEGRIFPKFRADLLECAVVAQRMRSGDIETTVVPRNPLDVLSQQIVAIAAAAPEDQPVAVDRLHELVTRTHSYATLSRTQLENVLDMLDGRYPSSEFKELRPRIVWDRVHGKIRARPGARQLAITSGGTIPDRGLYAVTLPDGRRVGELDEEMVYEARPGQTFLLGATTWRIEEITRDRVIVTPAPGLPGAVPFWKGDGVGRPKELGEAIGAFARWAVDQDARRARARLRPRPPRRQEPPRIPVRAAGRHARDPLRPCDRDRALPRRDRRLAPVRAQPVRRPRTRRLGAGDQRADPRGAGPRVRRDLVRRRDHRPPPRRRGAALRRPRADRARRGRGPRRRGAVGLGAVRRPLPRERLARAADPPRATRQAHPAVAAAAEGPVAARGRAQVRRLPDRARDLPRVPARRARPPRPDRAADASSTAARSASSRSRLRALRRSPRACCSTTSPRTCTRATRPTPSAVPPPCRSTATCCASCSARRSCAT